MPNTFQVPPPGGQIADKNGIVTRNWWWFFFSLFNSTGGGGAITVLGTVVVGVWNATRIAVGFGGTGSDLSATGGPHQVLRQSGAGSAVTVSQLTTDDISGLAPQGTVSFQTPTSGSTLTASAGQGTFEMAPAATLATLSVVLPPTPADGQLFEITTTQAITALTVTAPGGATVLGGTMLMSANGGISFRYRTADTTWRRRW